MMSPDVREAPGPPMSAARKPEKIVVGLDGSPPSRRALRWAIRQTRLTGGELHVVASTWTQPGADAMADSAIRQALDGSDAPPIHQHLAVGHPTRALLDEADDADLLVVGHGRPGEPMEPQPGGIDCRTLLTHSRCPVVIVPDRDRPDGT